MKRLDVFGVDRHTRLIELGVVVQRANLHKDPVKIMAARQDMRAAVAAKLTGDRIDKIRALIALRRASGVCETCFRDGHEILRPAP